MIRIDAHQHFQGYATHPDHPVWMTADLSALLVRRIMPSSQVSSAGA